ncbi:MAG: class I SAM-dependent methyltransferase [Candidatus Magasanikbacteria bacterium]|jgi:2-polyprenyl-3-methyl-5-hydroxy-6-metoxy-1,4-benzoquinol methylase|nr:class I SAM-dependent methyltransferase [Candidatus Magasanikbacteria bacterium]MBT4314844.1 class I SAM-dependent methyltransferase [Candidatus Magasanikbacteria bacterium]MBT4547621.1 class I SAM-dependent methyltransferase [Candidatus Magasanikbacteria bacterium]MBT6819352.1 class I SAM-dependent methyltransferase [Candidatus Magasanikbacteria bacterium]
MNIQQQYDKYFSAGFVEFNQSDKSRKVMSNMYEHNYAKFLPRDKESSVLDFGCGAGQGLSWLKDRGYKNYLGVDISKEAVEFCKAKKLLVEKIDGPIVWLKKNKEKYNVIISNDVIEHIPKEDIIPTMSALYGALKKGGVMIVKTNNVSALTGARMRYWDHTHSTSFTEFSMMQVLKYAGVEEFNFYPFTFPLNKPTRIIRRLFQSILHAIWKFIYWLEYTLVPKIVHEYFFAVIKK